MFPKRASSIVYWGIGGGRGHALRRRRKPARVPSLCLRHYTGNQHRAPTLHSRITIPERIVSRTPARTVSATPRNSREPARSTQRKKVVGNQAAMPRFYKGVGVGTYLHMHRNNVMRHGMQPTSPHKPYDINALFDHIGGHTSSPCMSLTRSFGVARDYAIDGRIRPASGLPGYVYAIDIDWPPPDPIKMVLDPVAAIAAEVNTPLAPTSYHHNGDMTLLLGLVNELTMRRYLTRLAHEPPGSSATPAPARIDPALRAIVRALRDAEIIVLGHIPSSCIKECYAIS